MAMQGMASMWLRWAINFHRVVNFCNMAHLKMADTGVSIGFYIVTVVEACMHQSELYCPQVGFPCPYSQSAFDVPNLLSAA